MCLGLSNDPRFMKFIKHKFSQTGAKNLSIYTLAENEQSSADSLFHKMQNITIPFHFEQYAFLIE